MINTIVIVFLSIIAVALIMLIIRTIWMFLRIKKLVSTGTKGKGLIIQLKRFCCSKIPLYFPVIQLDAENNKNIKETMVVKSEFTMSPNPKYSTGKEISIIYNPQDPTEIIIDDPYFVKGIPSIIRIIIFAVLVVGDISFLIYYILSIL